MDEMSWGGVDGRGEEGSGVDWNGGRELNWNGSRDSWWMGE